MWLKGVNDRHGLDGLVLLFFSPLVAPSPLFQPPIRSKLISDARTTRQFEILIYNPLEPGRGDVNRRGIDKPSSVCIDQWKGWCFTTSRGEGTRWILRWAKFSRTGPSCPVMSARKRKLWPRQFNQRPCNDYSRDTPFSSLTFYDVTDGSDRDI